MSCLEYHETVGTLTPSDMGLGGETPLSKRAKRSFSTPHTSRHQGTKRDEIKGSFFVKHVRAGASSRLALEEGGGDSSPQ